MDLGIPNRKVTYSNAEILPIRPIVIVLLSPAFPGSVLRCAVLGDA